MWQNPGRYGFCGKLGDMAGKIHDLSPKSNGTLSAHISTVSMKRTYYVA
jgi:hypothetical protein